MYYTFVRVYKGFIPGLEEITVPENCCSQRFTKLSNSIPVSCCYFVLEKKNKQHRQKNHQPNTNNKNNQIQLKKDPTKQTR